MATWWPFGGKKTDDHPQIIVTTAVSSENNPFIAGMKDIIDTTDPLREDSNFDNDFDLFDEMLKLDPELNGAVRTVSLTANAGRID